MKHLFFILACLALFVSPAMCQTDTSNTTNTAQAVSTTPGQVVIPAVPVAGSSVWDWIYWVISIALAFDVVTRVVPTNGRFSWITKAIGLLHDFLLWLDVQKKAKNQK
jgi:hypothetical protein